jgi:glyoxylase-like metal-dependent hydrolase (beta-lactamase superfamily II)
MGDDFFNGMFPFVDLESGGTVQGYVAAVEKVLADLPADVKIIPGHGPLASRDDLAGYAGMLRETMAVIQQGIKDGRSLEQLKAAKVLARWDKFGGGFLTTDKYIEELYAGLTGQKKNPSF